MGFILYNTYIIFIILIIIFKNDNNKPKENCRHTQNIQSAQLGQDVRASQQGAGDTTGTSDLCCWSLFVWTVENYLLTYETLVTGVTSVKNLIALGLRRCQKFTQAERIHFLLHMKKINKAPKVKTWLAEKLDCFLECLHGWRGFFNYSSVFLSIKVGRNQCSLLAESSTEPYNVFVEFLGIHTARDIYCLWHHPSAWSWALYSYLLDKYPWAPLLFQMNNPAYPEEK